MSKDNLPSPPISHNDVARQLESTMRAKRVRNPFTGWFRKIGDRSAETAIKGSTAIANATSENIDAQGGVVKAIMRLRDTVDDYEARDEKAQQYYHDALGRHQDNLDDNAHKRELAAKRRQQEQVDADRGVFNARQGLEKQESIRSLNQERWTADAYSARAKSTMRAETWRAAMTPEPDPTESPQASPLEALERKAAELLVQIQEAKADRQDYRHLQDDLESVMRTILLIKKAPG